MAKEILVTGGSGFIGSWTARYLNLKGYQVTCLVRDTSNTWRIQNCQGLKLVRASEAKWEETFSKLICDTVVLGDWWGVENKYRDCLDQEVNYVRWVKATQIAVKHGARTLIGIGSQAELGPVVGQIHENRPDAPTSEYGRVKSRIHERMDQLTRNTQTRFVWARAFSVYGQLDSESWFIPSLVSSLMTNKYFEMTAGEQLWSYTHAFDFARALHLLVDFHEVSGTINVGNPELIQISDLARYIAQKLERKSLLKVGAIPYRPDQIMHLEPVSAKLKDLGWLPNIPVRQGVNEVIDWLKGNEIEYITNGDGAKVKINLPIKPKIDL